MAKTKEPATLMLVRLNCSTPLRATQLYVETNDPAIAWQQFMTYNGISGSDHERTIDEVADMDRDHSLPLITKSEFV